MRNYGIWIFYNFRNQKRIVSEKTIWGNIDLIKSCLNLLKICLTNSEFANSNAEFPTLIRLYLHPQKSNAWNGRRDSTPKGQLNSEWIYKDIDFPK